MTAENRIRYRIAEISQGTDIEYPANPVLQRRHRRNIDLLILKELNTDYRKALVS